MKYFLQILLISTCLAFDISPQSSLTVIDLSHPISPKSPNPPWNSPYSLTNILRLNVTDDVVSVGNAFSVSEHTNTHIDAPRHFCSSGKTLDEVPAEQLTGPGVVLHLRAEAERNKDFEATQQTIEDWEDQHGRIPEGAMVLFDFGWDKHWPNINKIYQSETMDFGTFHHPGLSPEGAKWLVTNRKVKAVGIDTPSIDFGPTRFYGSHYNLCKGDTVILENLNNLGSVPSTGSFIFVGALKLVDGTGTPSRILAVLQSDTATITMSTVVAFMIPFIGVLYLLGRGR